MIRPCLGPLLLAALLITGCASKRPAQQPAPTTTAPGLARGLNQGYALLYDLLGDEQNVSKLLIVKRERTQLKNLIVRISDRAALAHRQLTEFSKSDPRLNLEAMGLPPAETDTRASIAKAKTKKLLGGKGKDFEIQLLLSQSEALMYASHLAQTTADKDLHTERIRFLRGLAQDLRALQEEVVGLLDEHYSWTPDR